MYTLGLRHNRYRGDATGFFFAVLAHNRPAAYRLSPEVHAVMLEHLHTDLRSAIQESIDSGPTIAVEDVFAEFTTRYTEPVTKTSDKRTI